MSVTVPVTYGWNEEGKTPEEIAADIRQTRYRLDADLQALKQKISPKRIVRRVRKAKWPTAAAAAAALAFVLIRRARR
jgi:hypothetical protein